MHTEAQGLRPNQSRSQSILSGLRASEAALRQGLIDIAPLQQELHDPQGTLDKVLGKIPGINQARLANVKGSGIVATLKEVATAFGNAKALQAIDGLLNGSEVAHHEKALHRLYNLANSKDLEIKERVLDSLCKIHKQNPELVPFYKLVEIAAKNPYNPEGFAKVISHIKSPIDAELVLLARSPDGLDLTTVRSMCHDKMIRLGHHHYAAEIAGKHRIIDTSRYYQDDKPQVDRTAHQHAYILTTIKIGGYPDVALDLISKLENPEAAARFSSMLLMTSDHAWPPNPALVLAPIQHNAPMVNAVWKTFRKDPNQGEKACLLLLEAALKNADTSDATVSIYSRLHRTLLEVGSERGYTSNDANKELSLKVFGKFHAANLVAGKNETLSESMALARDLALVSAAI